MFPLPEGRNRDIKADFEIREKQRFYG